MMVGQVLECIGYEEVWTGLEELIYSLADIHQRFSLKSGLDVGSLALVRLSQALRALRRCAVFFGRSVATLRVS